MNETKRSWLFSSVSKLSAITSIYQKLSQKRLHPLAAISSQPTTELQLVQARIEGENQVLAVHFFDREYFPVLQVKHL